MTDMQDGLFDNPPPPIICEHANCRKEIVYDSVGSLGRFRWIHVKSGMSQCDSSGTQWARPGRDTQCPKCDKPMPRNYCWDQCRVIGECPLGFMARDIEEGNGQGIVIMTPEEYVERTPERRAARAEIAHARTTDPITSHEAAASIKSEELRRSQQAVLAMFHSFGPMHDQLLVERYGYTTSSRGLPVQSESGLRTRRRELVDQGMLEDSGRKIVLDSGRKSIVWKLS
jgi:hypothetical protein